MTALVLSLALLASPDGGTPAPTLPPAFIAARKAYDRLKALDGKWVAVESGKESPASFEVVSGGAAVLQRAGFVAVYYIDGDSVMCTLFPDDGNQPRFRAHAVAESKGKAPTLDFRLVDITNLLPDAGYAGGLTLEFPADDKLVMHFRWHEHGKESTFDVALHRAAKEAPAPAPK